MKNIVDIHLILDDNYLLNYGKEFVKDFDAAYFQDGDSIERNADLSVVG